MNRAGDKQTNVDIRGMVNQRQIKSIRELEKGGRKISYVAGTLEDPAIGEGSRDLIKTLRQQQMMSKDVK